MSSIQTSLPALMVWFTPTSSYSEETKEALQSHTFEKGCKKQWLTIGIDNSTS
jgi:hypothetical protein